MYLAHAQDFEFAVLVFVTGDGTDFGRADIQGYREVRWAEIGIFHNLLVLAQGFGIACRGLSTYHLSAEPKVNKIVFSPAFIR